MSTEHNTSSPAFTDEDITRLREIIDEGCVVLQEVDDLKSSLKDLVTHVSDELGIKAAELNKAIKIVHKNSLMEEQEKFDNVLEIIQAVGKGAP